MTTQAQNTINLFRGNDPATIERAVRMLRESVRKELMEHFHASDIKDLAVKMSR